MDYSQLPLRDMHLPEPIGWWPLAPGWWAQMVLTLVLVLAGILYYRNRRTRQHITPRKAALAELAAISAAHHLQEQQLAAACNTLLKRLALSLYPRQQIAALTGQQWLDFLQRNGEAEPPMAYLASAPYQRQADIDRQALLSACEHWINTTGRPHV